MSKLNHINYFKQQANLLLEDYMTRYFDESQDIYYYNSKNYDITQIFLDYDIYDDEEYFEFDLNDAQDLIAQISGFKDWRDLINSSEEKLNFAHLLLENQHHANLEEWNTYLSSIKGPNWSGLLDPDNKYSDDDYVEFKEIFTKVFIEGNIKSEFTLYKLNCENNQNDISNYNENREVFDNNIEYFKRQSKLLLKDYKILQENDFDRNKVFFEEPEKHFDLEKIFSKIHKKLGEKISLMNAQHIIARILGFENWGSLLKANSLDSEIAQYQLKFYKLNFKNNSIYSEISIKLKNVSEFVENKIYELLNDSGFKKEIHMNQVYLMFYVDGLLDKDVLSRITVAKFKQAMQNIANTLSIDIECEKLIIQSGSIMAEPVREGKEISPDILRLLDGLKFVCKKAS